MRIFLTGATGVIGRRVLPMSNRKLRRTSGWVPVTPACERAGRLWSRN